MRDVRRSVIRVSAALVLTLGLALTGSLTRPAPARPALFGPHLELVRELPTSEYGVPRPRTLAWSPRLGSLLLSQGRRLVRLAPDDTPRGVTRLPATPRTATLTVHPRTGTIVYVDGRRIHARPGAALTSGATGSRRYPNRLGHHLEALAHDRAGRLVGLDGTTLVHRAAGRLVRVPLRGVTGHDLRGLARWPGTALLVTYDADQRRVLSFDAGGRLVRTLPASSLGLRNVTGLAIAPSADHTDAAGVQHVYLADAGNARFLGRIVEASVETTSQTFARATGGSLVRSVATSAYNPASPDPSGIAYLPGADQLFIADGEVDEMPIYQGSNLFATTRLGSVVARGDSHPWSKEPVGVGYNPTNNHLFVSDDDQQEVFEIVAGSDGAFGTTDDTVTHFDTAGSGNGDPEGIDFDPVTNSLWAVDGVNTQVYRYRAGGDGRLGTADDIRSNFDVGVYGALDPEGMAYDPVRDTIAIVDDKSQKIYEMDKTGALLNTISIAGYGVEAAAGLAIAPASGVSSRQNYYVVARGVDNNSDPNENDGRLYEFSAVLDPIGDTNQPPLAGAGADQTVVLPAAATLDGTISDDGRPNPPALLTSTWSKVSGPGTVSFGNAQAADTTATFGTAGTYVLRITASDSVLVDSDDVTVQVLPEGSSLPVEVAVAAGSDDAEQSSGGSVSLTSSDLELVTDGTTVQTVGTRFPGLPVPAGAVITNAWVQFRADEVSTGATSLTVRAEAADNAPTYLAVSNNITSRPKAAPSVSWIPSAWNTIGEQSAAQRTPDLSTLVQAVTDRPGWASGNALALQFSGSGRRTAKAFEGGAGPILHVEFRTSGAAPNRAPTVSAGPDRSVLLTDSASLDGTVTDDGLPDPPAALSLTWSVASGPGAVTFGSPNTADTTATFGAPGSYVLRLTAWDGALAASDDVAVTVIDPNAPQVLDVPIRTGADDAEERYTGAVDLTSNDLDITQDGKHVSRAIGLRFTDIGIPSDAVIDTAYVQFAVDESGAGAAAFTIRAQASDDAPAFVAATNNLTARAMTAAAVPWSPPDWTTLHAAGPAQRTPDLSGLLDEVISRPGWGVGHALAILVTGTGSRTAESFEGAPDPVLHVEWHR